MAAITDQQIQRLHQRLAALTVIDAETLRSAVIAGDFADLVPTSLVPDWLSVVLAQDPIPGTKAVLALLATMVLAESDAIALHLADTGRVDTMIARWETAAHQFYVDGWIATAVSLFQHILTAYEALPGTEREQATCWINLGICLRDLGDPDTARAQATCWLNLGKCLSILGELEDAGTCYEQSLEAFTALPGTEREQAACCMSIGICLRDLGDPVAAQRHLEWALDAFEALPGAAREQVICRINLGNCLHANGDLSAAKTQLEWALHAFASMPDSTREQAQCRGNLGVCLVDLGDLRSARTHFEWALDAFMALPGAAREQAICRMNLGTCLHALGDLGGSQTYLEQALAEFEALPGSTREQAYCRMNLGICLRELGNLGGARTNLEWALAAYEALPGTARVQAGCWMNLGNCLSALGELAAAVESLTAAENLLVDIGAESDKIRALLAHAWAQIHLAQDNLDAAWVAACEAMDRTDRLAARLTDDLRIGYRESTLATYQTALGIALARDEGLPDAFGTAQRAKGRTITEQLEVRGEFAALEQVERALVAQIDLLRQRPDPDADRLAELGERLRATREERLALRAAQQGTDPRQPWSLADITKMLRPGEVLLDAVELRNDGTLCLFLLWPDGTLFTHHVDSNALTPLVTAWTKTTDQIVGFYRQAQSHPDFELDRSLRRLLPRRQTLLQEIGQLLLHELEPLFPDTMETLIVSPGGLLHQLPIAALPLSSGMPIIERFAVQLIPTATSLGILRNQQRPTWPPSLLGAAPFCSDFGDSDEHGPVLLDPDPSRVPVLCDVVRDTAPNLLPASRDEILGIAATLNAIAPGATPDPLLANAATRTAVLERLPAAHLVHLSTHGSYREHPLVGQRLHILLAGGSTLALEEIYDGTVTLPNVFSFTLSACLLGQVARRGEEAMGFNQALLSAGAGVVLAALWEVVDVPTAQLMQAWYSALAREDHPSVAAAWREAVLKLRQQEQWADPYYWAGFLPNGDGALALTPP